MSHWNYRMVHMRDGSYSVHEVYYNDAGEATSMTRKPVSLYGESPQGIKGDLLIINTDIRRRPIFEEPEIWASSEVQA